MNARYVLVGNSAASLAAIDWIRRFDREGSIRLLSREEGTAYSRVALPYLVSGEKDHDRITIRSRRDYDRDGVELVEGAEVVSIDPDARVVELVDGRSVTYERLHLGTGSECIVPPIEGLSETPHHYLWTLEDAVRMKEAAASAKRALVIGGGFIGMLAAEALRKLRIDLTIVEMTDQLMPQLLDREGGKIFARAVAGSGVDLRLDSKVSSVSSADGLIRVGLGNGSSVDTELLVVAAGVRPCVTCDGANRLEKRRGFVVDETLRTSAEDVWASGDCAEAPDFLTGEGTVHAIWPTAVDQGRIAGANMTGKRIRHPGSLGMNVVELFGVTLAQLGRFRESGGDRVEVSGGAGGNHYRKVVIGTDGMVVGAMYLGDGGGVAEMGVIHHALKRRESWDGLVRGGLRPAASYAALLSRVPGGLSA